MAGTLLILAIVAAVTAIVPKEWTTADGRPISGLLVYYMIAKGLLLTHYYYDTFLFTRRDELAVAEVAPAAA
jgi:hypothetical protein